jgi:hypothetical protein
MEKPPHPPAWGFPFLLTCSGAKSMVDYENLDEYFRSLKAQIETLPVEQRAATWTKVLDIVGRYAGEAKTALDAELSAAKEQFKLQRSAKRLSAVSGLPSTKPSAARRTPIDQKK